MNGGGGISGGGPCTGLGGGGGTGGHGISGIFVLDVRVLTTVGVVLHARFERTDGIGGGGGGGSNGSLCDE